MKNLREIRDRERVGWTSASPILFLSSSDPPCLSRSPLPSPSLSGLFCSGKTPVSPLTQNRQSRGAGTSAAVHRLQQKLGEGRRWTAGESSWRGTRTGQGSPPHRWVPGLLSRSGGCQLPPDSVRAQSNWGKPSLSPDQPCSLPLTHQMLSPAKPIAW